MPVVCAGQLITPGDAIVADDDGVAVVQRKDAQQVLDEGRKREEAEDGKRVVLESGKLGLDIYNMRPRLEEAGFEYLDSLDDL